MNIRSLNAMIRLTFHGILLPVACCGLSPAALADAPTLGAIRWDGWFADNPYQADLKPAEFSNRLPFYTTGANAPTMTVVSDAQDVMDREIDFARDGGLSYWAFCWYSPKSFSSADRYNYGLRRYLASKRRAELGFCLLLQGQHLGPADDWTQTADDLVVLMSERGYQHVLGDRPIVYVYSVDQLNKTFGATAAVKRAIQQLRAKARAKGLGDLYLVAQVFRARDGAAAVDQLGFDAIGQYAFQSAEDTREYPFPVLEAQNEQFWNACERTGKAVVPGITLGWDNRPRWPGGVNGAASCGWFQSPAPGEITRYVLRADRWAVSHAVADPSRTILIYAWNESDEGGWLVPTLSEQTARLRAVRAAVDQFGAESKH